MVGQGQYSLIRIIGNTLIIYKYAVTLLINMRVGMYSLTLLHREPPFTLVQINLKPTENILTWLKLSDTFRGYEIVPR